MKQMELFSLQNKIFDRIAHIMGALSSSARLMLIHVLAQSPQTVETLSQMSRLSIANTSQHLQKMARAGIVEVEKQGVNRIYRLRTSTLLPVWESLQELAHILDPELDKVESTLANVLFNADQPIEGIKKDIKSGKAILLDVRTARESTSTPIPRAINIPSENLKKGTPALPKRKSIYVICRGRYCATATQAVEYLRHCGFKAYRLKESPFRMTQIGDKA